jgi:thiol-disulfide isomerase/thioredoxin
LKGRVVYLGFWAGWCRQCIGEIIAETKTKDLLRNKPVEFVYISLGDDTSGERQIMARYKVSGIFARAIGGWDSKEVKQFGVQALPAYYLIDEDGNFAAQMPPTPMQSTELVIEISKLFN